MITVFNKTVKNQYPKIMYLFVLGLMVFSTSSVHSLTNKQFLASVLPDNCYFSGDFKQSKKIKSLPKPLESKGGFLYSCKLGLIWETKSPIQESLVFSSEKMNFLVKDEKTAKNLESVQHNFLAKLLLGLMAADISLIEKEFVLELSGVGTQKSLLTMVPKGKMIKKARESVVLEKPKNLKSLIITITDKNQQVTTINTNEVAQYDDDNGFKKRCVTQEYHSNACDLLLDPERVRDK